MTKTVEVDVIKSQSDGVRVMLEDGRQGVIRPKELSWDRSVNAQLPELLPGQSIKAKIIHDRKNDRYVYLSLRQLTDPWKDKKINTTKAK